MKTHLESKIAQAWETQTNIHGNLRGPPQGPPRRNSRPYKGTTKPSGGSGPLDCHETYFQVAVFPPSKRWKSNRSFFGGKLRAPEWFPFHIPGSKMTCTIFQPFTRKMSEWLKTYFIDYTSGPLQILRDVYISPINAISSPLNPVV